MSINGGFEISEGENAWKIDQLFFVKSTKGNECASFQIKKKNVIMKLSDYKEIEHSTFMSTFG